MCILGPCGREASAEGGDKEEGTVGRSTRRVILICEECGERLVLGEPEEVWLSTRTRFECECGGGRLLDQPPGGTRTSGALRETELKPAPAKGL